jgi:hypothetical protein
MNETLLIPQRAESLHPNTQEIVAMWIEGFHRVALIIKETVQGIIDTVLKIARPIVDWWKRVMEPRVHRHSKQTRAFLRIVNGSKRHNEIHAKQRKRSVRRISVSFEGEQ